MIGRPVDTSLLLAGEDSNKAGPIGLLVLVLLGIACYWLFRSMSKHLRRVPTSFTTAGEPTERAPLTPAPPASAPPTPGDRPAVDGIAGVAHSDDPVDRAAQ